MIRVTVYKMFSGKIIVDLPPETPDDMIRDHVRAILDKDHTKIGAFQYEYTLASFTFDIERLP